MGSNLIENLRRFNSHERGLLLEWASGHSLAVGGSMRSAVANAIHRTPPSDAFVAMDYTLDWLYAAIRATVEEEADTGPYPWPADDALTGSQEDVDLLLAWEDDDGPHIVLIEAKGFTGWSNKTMSHKAARLGVIFAGEMRNRFDVHFFLAGPAPSKGLIVDSWPHWVRPGARTHFLSIDDPGERYAVQRCDAHGTPTHNDWTHWRVIRRSWRPSTEPDIQETAASPEPRRGGRTCSRCGALPAWLVTARYTDAQSAGRLLIYCDRCRGEMVTHLGTVLPLDSFDVDPNAVLSILYQSRATFSDPHLAAEAVGVSPGPWMEVAKHVIDLQSNSGSDGQS